MKVILKERVKSLGNIGEIVNVSAGHARNFLIPSGFAVLADESNTAQVEHYTKMLAKKVAEQKGEAEATAKGLNGLSMELIKRVGGNGKLFGSVTTQELSEELAKLGHDVERRHLSVEKPIREIGTFDVKVKVFSGVEASFQVTIAMDPAQIEENKKRSEEIAEAKKVKAELDALNAENAGEENAELSEEEKLKQEANRILRS
ncbi:MAG: hypothetical protein BM556_07055 [Bacteriovorax sp. MedPE-SWde]|nr:MAG: hypothetical protein BM556_07055 [Bacteriovorax sp. MedPE-SWde]